MRQKEKYKGVHNSRVINIDARDVSMLSEQRVQEKDKERGSSIATR
jgi:hypothetical protein